MSETLTKAVYARRVGTMLRRTSVEIDNLTEGMWNPAFCSSNARGYAEAFCRDMQAHIDRIRAALAPTPDTGGHDG